VREVSGGYWLGNDSAAMKDDTITSLQVDMAIVIVDLIS